MNEFLKLLGDVWGKNVVDDSVAGELNKVDWAKIVRNSLQVAGSAALAAGAGYVGEELLKVNWGTLAVFVLPLIHMGMDTITKKLKDNTVTQEK